MLPLITALTWLRWISYIAPRGSVIPSGSALARELLHFPEREFCNTVFLTYLLACGEGAVTAMPHNTPIKLLN